MHTMAQVTYLFIEGDSISSSNKVYDIFWLYDIKDPHLKHSNKYTFEQLCDKIQSINFTNITIYTTTTSYPAHNISGRALAILLNFLIDIGCKLIKNSSPNPSILDLVKENNSNNTCSGHTGFS